MVEEMLLRLGYHPALVPALPAFVVALVSKQI
jgi:hypothetical protein